MIDYEQKLVERVAELEKQVHDLEKNLIHDSLTSLKTRAFFEEALQVYITSVANADLGKRGEWFGFKNISILFLDIDHFKKVNDTYGHGIGDLVLRTVAETITKSVRDGDIVARWGGEEIVALLLGANESDAKIKAEDIRSSIENLTFSAYPDLKVTISIGISHYTSGLSIEEIIKRADTAVYKAKEMGRNKTVMFSEIGK